MSNVFFISDLHFGHKSIKGFSGELRSGDDYIDNMHNIILNWNSVVTKRDVVYVLGDVAFSDEGLRAVQELNGSKKLVMGNHDAKYGARRMLQYFTHVTGLRTYKDFWLSHCPMHPHEMRGRKNIHGHVHSNSIRNPYTGEYDKNYINVCCEAIGDTPIPFDCIKDESYWSLKKI